MISSQTARRLFRYILTGGTAAVVDLTVFTVLHMVGLPIGLAASCSFCVAAVVNYALCSIFVFGHALSLRQLSLFVVVALVGMGINVGVTVTANQMIPFGQFLSRAGALVGMGGDVLKPFAATLAKVCGIGVAFLFNFYLNSTVVFRDRAREDPATAA
jgi:putative flippase GtrA